LRAWRRPLQAAVAQAQSLQERRLVVAEESRVPELQRLTRSMNALVRRLQGVFESQAAQLDELRAQAHLDPVTGVLRRRQFVARLGAALGAERHRGAGLLLVRLRRLDAMNRRIGHDATDRLLAALAQVLQSYPRHVKGALTGRLNGADFALYLPAGGMAQETSRSLVEALRAALAAVDQGADLAIGAVELDHSTGAADALSMADGALAQAESGGSFAVEVRARGSAGAVVLGQQQWHARLTDALRAGRMQLADAAMLAPDGALLHLDCTTRLQFDAEGPFEPAANWLAMAVRCRLVASVDLAALDLALAALKRDGLPRCIHVATASLADAGFIDEVQQRLQAAPDQASRIGLEFVDAVALQAKPLQRASLSWRRCGARVGLVHAGANLRQLSRLTGVGVDYMKVDGAFVQGAAQLPAVRELARGLVVLMHDMGLQILVEGVGDAADLSALWALGFDGASGPVLRADGFG
jgi:predicted signal transduction protein with EAL and GGDEF domain